MAEAGAKPSGASTAGPKKRVQRGAQGGATDHLFLRLPTATKRLINDKARAAGMSATAYIIEAATGNPPIRARRSPTVNAEVLARLTAELNKIGSNINQIAKAANSISRVDAEMLRDAIAQLLALRAEVLRALNMDGGRDAE